MPHNFDEARRARAEADNEFILGGETFTRRPLRPETFARYAGLELGAGDEQATLDLMDELVLTCIDDSDGGHDRYRAVRARESGDIITLRDLSTLVEWLVEAETGTPTLQRSGSSDGASTAGLRSLGGSPSPGSS